MLKGVMLSFDLVENDVTSSFQKHYCAFDLAEVGFRSNVIFRASNRSVNYLLYSNVEPSHIVDQNDRIGPLVFDLLPTNIF